MTLHVLNNNTVYILLILFTNIVLLEDQGNLKMSLNKTNKRIYDKLSLNYHTK